MAGQMTIQFQKNLCDPLMLDLLNTVFQQGDKNAQILRIEVMDGAEKADLASMTVTGQFERGDGNRVPITGNINGNVVFVTIPEACYNVSGAFVAFVRLTSENNYVRRTILRIAGMIEPQSDGPLVDPGHTLPSVDELISRLHAMENAADACNEAANSARTAAQAALEAASSAAGWGSATASATQIAAGSTPTVNVTTQSNGNKKIVFGVPAGVAPASTFEVATGAPGSNVQMEQSGPPEAPNIKLTIPRGSTGAVDGLIESCCSVATYAAGANVVFSKDPTQYTYLLPRLNYVTGPLLKTSGSAGSRTIVASTINAGSSNMTITTLTLKETSVITEWEITAIQRAILSSTGVVYSNPETLSISFEGLTLK